MDKKILIWLIILAVLALISGYLLIGNNTTTTTTTLQGITSTTFSPTTTRAITRPTQPTTTQVGATTLPATTLPGTTTTTSTTIQSSSNATTTSTTVTTQPDHTNPQTTTTSTTLSGATTTTVPGATTSTTTQPGATTTTLSGTTTTTTLGATTTSTTTTTTPGATTTRTTTTTTTTSTTTRTTTTTTSTTTTTTTSTTQPLSSGPVIYLKFDETAGSTAYDSSLGSNDANLVSGPVWASGRSGNALRFDGTNDYVDAGNSASLDVTGPITIMLWVNPSIAQEVCYPAVGENRGVAAKVDAASGSTRWSWQLRYGSPTSCALGFQFNDPVNGRRWVSVAQALTPGQWYHVTATFDGSTARSYINGVLKESMTMSSIQSYPTTKLLIGADGWGDYFSGRVDDFRIYKRALSATEINQIISTVPSTTTPTTTATTKATTTPTTTATTKATTTPTTTATTRATTTPTTTATTRATTTPTTTATTKATTPTTIPAGGAVYVADYGISYGETAGDQTSKVNSAISAAVSQGKTLVFPANQVIAINGILDFKSLTVIGQGCRLFLMAGHDGGSGGGGWQWMKLGVGGKMSGMIIDGNRANQGDGIFGNVHGIRLMGNNIFEYNTVKRVTSYGVVLYAGSPPTNVYIRNNVFDDIGQYGVTTGCTDGDYCYGHNVVVTDNTFRECHEVGVKLRGTVGATIARNTITVGTRLPGRDTPSGIRLYSWDDPNWDIVIQDNTITGLDGAGTVCIDSDDSQNYRITITGNTVSHCDTGIELQFTGGTITNNRISSCNTCISGSSGNTVTGNTCT